MKNGISFYSIPVEGVEKSMQLVKEELELNRKNVRKIAGWIKLNQQIEHNTPQKDKSLRERWSGSPFIRRTDLYTFSGAQIMLKVRWAE